jgi:hypothetical protein
MKRLIALTAALGFAACAAADEKPSIAMEKFLERNIGAPQ